MSKFARSILPTAFIAALAFSIPFPLLAQSAISRGTISGTVTDPSGAAVPGATISAANEATGMVLKTKTNQVGFYSFPSLSVGDYDIRVSHAGFKTATIHNLVLQVGQTMTANATLEVGAVSQTVTVTGQTPLLRPEQASVGSVVNNSMIQNLPLSGRRYTDFVLLTPNANPDGEFGLVSIGGQQGGGDSGYANGNGANSYTVDGANFTSNYFGGARGRTRVPYVFGEQSIQEFQVSDNPYNAVYGGAGSGFVNTVTKSGTDAFHGDAFYYNRNSGVGNANDAIDKANGIARPLDILQQFGADLGGPIERHKAWFYFDYEQQRRKFPISVINPGYGSLGVTDFGLPAGTALPQPNGPLPVPGGFDYVPTSPTDPNWSTYLQQVSNALYAFHSNLGLRQRRADDLTFFPKLDWQASNNADHLTLDYNYNKFNSPGGTFTFNPVPSFGDEALPNNYVRDHHATAHWTHTFGPTLLNDVHVSFTRDEQISTPSGLISATLPTIYNFSRGFFALGNPTFAVGDTREFQWQINERVSYIVGRHSLDFGFDFDRTHITDFYPGNFQGTYLFFGAPSNFALGSYDIYQQAAGNPIFRFTFPYYGFYGQDKFRATKRLTLELGLREDFQVFPQPQANNRLGPVVARLTSQFPNQYMRISPRIGFAYQPSSRTVVRGGFGIFREIFDGINYENSVAANGSPTRQSSTSIFCFSGCAVPNQRTVVFPNALSNTSSFSGSSDISVVDPGLRTPYILESSLEIQRELLANTTLSVGTMWTHGVHLISSSAYDLNLMPPTGTTTYTICPSGFGSSGCAGSPGRSSTLANLDGGLLQEGRIAPGVGQINALISPGINNYNSFYVQWQQRNFHRVTSTLSYTFAKDLQSNGVDFNNQFNFSDTRGPTLLDQRHRLSIATYYTPPVPATTNAFTQGLLSGWTISSVMAFNSGRPYTALLLPANDTVNNSAANESTGNTAAGIAGAAPVPFEGYNAFYGPWIDEVDLGISRAFRISERQRFTVTAQVFNLFNHPNFYVQNGSGIYASQYDTNGTTCGDGSSPNQTCYLTPDPAFGTLESIDQLNGPRTFQFAFRYSF